jgi:hypothetical protein
MSTSFQDEDAVSVDEATDAMDEKEELLEWALMLWSSYARVHCGPKLDEEEEETREAPEEEAARLGTVPRRCMFASGDAEAEVTALLAPLRSFPEAVERSAYGFAAVREVLRLSARDGRRKLLLRLETPASSPFVASDSLSSAMAAAAAAAAARRGNGRIPLPAGMPAVEDMSGFAVVVVDDVVESQRLR